MTTHLEFALVEFRISALCNAGGMKTPDSFEHFWWCDLSS
jgi:hypothetical protein